MLTSLPSPMRMAPSPSGPLRCEKTHCKLSGCTTVVDAIKHFSYSRSRRRLTATSVLCIVHPTPWARPAGVAAAPLRAPLPDRPAAEARPPAPRGAIWRGGSRKCIKCKKVESGVDSMAWCASASPAKISRKCRNSSARRLQCMHPSASWKGLRTPACSP